MSILEFVESINNEIHHSDSLVKEKALKKLTEHLNKISYYSTNAATVDCLVSFYLNLLDEHYSVSGILLDGISALIDFKEFSDKNAQIVAPAILQMDVVQLNASVRLSILNILERLFTHHLSGMMQLGKSFVLDYISAVSGENDPECVLRVLRINAFIAGNLKIDDISEELFDTVSAYFPMDFKKSKSTGSLTRHQLAEANKRAMIASPLFGGHLFPMLLDKISSDLKSSRLDSMDILMDAVSVMDFDDILNYYSSFLDVLYHEYKNIEPEILELVRKGVRSFATVFSQKATEKQLLEFSWRIFELCYGAVNDDKPSMEFMMIAIEGLPKIWCAVMAHFLPKVVEKVVQEELEDLERLENLVKALLACDCQHKYPGLVNTINWKQVIVKATNLFLQAPSIAVATESSRQRVVLFHLLAAHSLFESGMATADTDANASLAESQMSVVANAISEAVANDDMLASLIDLVPRMVAQSVDRCGPSHGNRLTSFLIAQIESKPPIASIDVLYRVLRSLPRASIDLVLRTVSTGILDSVTRECSSACLAVLTERFEADCDKEVAAQLHRVVLEAVNALVQDSDSIDQATAENIALAIAHIAPLGSESKLLAVLLSTMRRDGPRDSLILWLCATIGQCGTSTLSTPTFIHELLYTVLGLISMPSTSTDPQLHAILCQTFASIVNKAAHNGDDGDIDRFVLESVQALSHNALFLLCLLRAAVHSGTHKAVVDAVVTVVTNHDVLSSPLAADLCAHIQILSNSKSSDNNNRHFCTDARLLPNQTMFYEQQMFYLLGQRYQTIAVAVAPTPVVKDAAMELYLRVVGGLSTDVLEMCLDEVISTVVLYLPLLSRSPDKAGLRVQVLRSLSNLYSESVAAGLTGHLHHVGVIIVSVAANYGSLSVDDRLSLARSIGWFLNLLKGAELYGDVSDIRRIVARMLADKKRVVRLEAVKIKMLLL